MLNDTSNLETFYQQQNIKIRKEIREMDLQIKDLLYNSKLNNSEKQEILSKLNVNFLVIGPSKSGKTSLLKTMNFALNSTFNPDISISQLPGTIVKKFEIKKSKKYQIEGLTKLKQTDQKKAVSGIQFEDKPDNSVKGYGSDEKSSKVFQKYSNALQMIDNRIFGCFKLSTTPSNQLFKSQSNPSSSLNSIKTVLIVLNIVSKIQFEQMSCMKFFLNDIRQKGIKILIILTHVDKLNQLSESDKLRVIQQRIEILRKQLDFKDREDFICIQNYHELNGSSTINQPKLSQHYLSPQSSHHNKNKTQNDALRQNEKVSYSTKQEKINYPYKKVSQLSLMEESFRIQVPLIGKYQQFNEMPQQPKYYQSQDKNQTVSRSITNNPTSHYPYAKVSAKNIPTLPNLPESESPNPYIKKYSTQNPQQSLSSNHHSYQNFNSSQSTTFKNSQQINFYSLKLLIKILKQNDKYTQTEFKQKKFIKWFCG